MLLLAPAKIPTSQQNIKIAAEIYKGVRYANAAKPKNIPSPSGVKAIITANIIKPIIEPTIPPIKLPTQISVNSSKPCTWFFLLGDMVSVQNNPTITDNTNVTNTNNNIPIVKKVKP